MTDRAYIISRTLENKIAIAENNDQNTLLVTLDVLKEILTLLKEQDAVVRCISCTFYRSDGECSLHNGRWKPEGFCSWAIREEGR